MADRAETLSYRVVGKPKTDVYENSAFRVQIGGGLATFRVKQDYGSLEEARRVVNDFLCSFEADEIFQGDERVTFEFESGQMESGRGEYIGLRFNVTVAGPRAEANLREQSPWKRAAVAETPDARVLVNRYEAYKSGKEQLTTLAYVVLSTLQQRAGGRQNAAGRYRVASDVLDRIGKLSSDRGDLASARKLDQYSSNLPLAPSETFWLEAATRSLIIRLNEVESQAGDLSDITMQDLPSPGGAV